MGDANRTAVRYAKEPSFAAPIGGAYTSQTVTFSTAAPANNDTVTVNGVVYTFKTGSLLAARDVAAGATHLAAAQNFCDAVNASPTTVGTTFYSTTTANAYAVATIVAGVVTLSAKLHGTAANSYTLAKSGANIAVGGATFAGGLASNYATMTELRYLSSTLKNMKVTLESEEIRSDRSATGLIKVGIGAGGDVHHELHYGDLETFIASAMMTPVVAGSSTATDWSVASNVLSKAAATPAAVLSARFVKIAGFANAANNGIKRVSISGNNLTILDGTMVNESAGPSVTVSWNYSRQGTTLESYVMESEITDAGIVIPLTGMCVNTWALNMVARSKALTTFGFLGFGLPSGTTSRTDTIGNAITSASLNPIMNTTANVARLLFGGVANVIPVNQLDWTLNNNLRERLVLAREGTLTPGTGESSITGTIKAYLLDRTLYNLFLAHTEMALEYSLVDSGGRTINVYCPAIDQGDGTYDVPGKNQDVYLNLTFKAKKALGHDGTQFQAQVDMLS